MNPWHRSPETEPLAIPMYKQGIVISGIDIAEQSGDVACPDCVFFSPLFVFETSGFRLRGGLKKQRRRFGRRIAPGACAKVV